jgi:serine/threonine protein kinase
MNAESNKIRESLVDQLSSFEERLDSKIDDVRLLADIQEGIGQLIGTTDGNEAEIRRVLQDRYDSGDLRKETFQLVKSMLDRFVTEDLPTSGAVKTREPPKPVQPSNDHDHEHVQTIADAARELAEGPASLIATTVLPNAKNTASVPADDRAQIGSVLRDRFMLQERVAGGSMGVVYKALDRRLAEAGTGDPFVAVKVLSSELAENGQALRALQQEAAKGRCLTHPNIVRFIDLDRDDDLYFIVMEWLEGQSLADILDSPDTGKMEKQRAFEIIEQIGKALEYAHRCGIVHADVKPGNIMIMANGEAKLLDFGVARVRQKQVENRKDFDPGVLGLLTPAYSSMQVLTGEDPTPTDDVFSLACLMYRLLAGYRVFGPRNAAEAAAEGMKPQCPHGLDSARWKVLKKALSYSRITRYVSMQEFIDALDLGHDEGISLTIPPRDDFDMYNEPQDSGRWIAGLIVLLGLLGGAAYQFGFLDGLKGRFLPENSDVVQLPALEEPAVAEVETPQFETVLPEEITTANVGEAEIIAKLPIAIEDLALEAITVAEFEPANSASEEGLLEEIVAADGPAEPALVDFSSLPAATIELQIDLNGSPVKARSVILREGGDVITIDVVRSDVTLALTLRLEESGFSGNRSPWVSRQYTIVDGDTLTFPAGQSHARITLLMTQDVSREADQKSTLRIREAGASTSELASINVILEDDDQRAFEATMPANTVAFATTQMTVRERDPAVQIDILRFNPDNTPLVVKYRLRDVTATQGKDYFAPGSDTIEFAPEQRTARLLIPLVQDVAFEDNEAFRVELIRGDPDAGGEVYAYTAVIIRDDDS